MASCLDIYAIEMCVTEITLLSYRIQEAERFHFSNKGEAGGQPGGLSSLFMGWTPRPALLGSSLNCQAPLFPKGRHHQVAVLFPQPQRPLMPREKEPGALYAIPSQGCRGQGRLPFTCTCRAGVKWKGWQGQDPGRNRTAGNLGGLKQVLALPLNPFPRI